MRVLMIGWEFPPAYSGGLGVACEGLVRGLVSLGCDVSLLLPRRPRPSAPNEPRLSADRGAAGTRLHVIPVGTNLVPYGSADGLYGDELRDEVSHLAAVARVVARRERFDVIHVHDWMTYPAGLAAQEAAGVPLLEHVHATEYSRSGGGAGDPFISAIEKEGLRRAERVLCVSGFTAGVVRRRYGIGEDRIRVVHNAIDGSAPTPVRALPTGPPLVLFAGRLTRQKGPGRFLEAAQQVLARRPDARFVIAGAGDRLSWLQRRVAELGLSGAVEFAGFLGRQELDALFQRSTVYVLPSVTEPFGLTVLEALRLGVPTVASSHAGVTEVVRSLIRVDAGSANELTGAILSILESPALQARLSRMGRVETARMSWALPAARCLEIYREVA